MTTQRRLKIGLIGLGRLGAIRARILAFQQPRIELVAACDTKPGAAEWAAADLPPSVQFFADPDDLMKNSGAEAILISTATATHPSLITKGFDAGLVSLTTMVCSGLQLTATSTLCVRSPSRWMSSLPKRSSPRLLPSLTSSS